MPEGTDRLRRLRRALGMSSDRLPSDLEPAFNALIDRLLLVGLFLYPFVLAGYAYRITLHGWKSNIAVQAGFYLLILGSYLLRTRIRYRTRALGVLAVLFAMSALGLYQWGLVGMGILSLFFVVLLASILLGTWRSSGVFLASVIVILAVGYGAVRGDLHQELDLRLYVTSWNGWLVAVTHFALNLLVILIAFGTLSDELIRRAVAAKQRARELEESRSRLKEEVSQRKELEAQFIQAQKMEAVGRLAGGVAHDFNNQLFVIMSMAEMLERRMGPDSPHRRSLDVIQQSARRSADLTRQLLTFSRKQTIQPRVLSLNEVVRGIESMLRRLIGEDIGLSLELDPNLELVNLDQGLLEQTIVNLVVNARDAMPQGGALTIGTLNRFVEETRAGTQGHIEPGRYVLLTVSDTGTGMRSEIVSHIFEPFFTTKERGKGTGLGLSSVYGFVKQSGGEALVDSQETAGTTFTLYFPQFEMEGLPADPREEPAGVRGGHETILVVEDEEDVRDLLSVMLGEMGYTVVLCGNAEEALEEHEMRLEPIDLLITDLVLPGMPGRELADRIQTRRKDLKTVFISGYSEDVISHHGVLEEGVHFIQKPFDYNTLGRKVREALEAG